MNYNRLIIDLIKSSFTQYAATGTINEDALTDGISQLNRAIDKALISNEDASVLESMKSVLQYIRYDLL